jgi:hypothetical protein
LPAGPGKPQAQNPASERKLTKLPDTGDQQTWGDLKCAVHPGPMGQFFASYFAPGEKMVEVLAKRCP